MSDNTKKNPYSLLLVLASFAVLFNFTACTQACSRSQDANETAAIFQGSVPPTGGVLGPIAVRNVGSLYSIIGRQSLSSNGDYCVAVFTLLNYRQEELYSFMQEFFYEEGIESGVDEDGAWSEHYKEEENRALSDVVMRDSPIYIKVTTELSGINVTEPIQIKIIPKKTRNPIPHGLAGLFILLIAITYDKMRERSEEIY